MYKPLNELPIPVRSLSSTVEVLIPTGVSAGKFVSDSVGIVTNTPVGVQTSTLDDKDLTGIGNSFKGVYVANGMLIHDSELTGVHYIGTSFRGMMAGPVSIAGTLTVDGNYVVV